MYDSSNSVFSSSSYPAARRHQTVRNLRFDRTKPWSESDKLRPQKASYLDASTQIYLGDHLTRSWTRDERRGSKQLASPVLSEPCVLSATPSVYQLKQGRRDDERVTSYICPCYCFTTHPTITRTRSSIREPRGSRKTWANRSAMQTVTPEELHKWKQSFDDLLQSPIGSKLFRVFLESEIAEENLLFWEACEELKQMKKEKRMQKLIQNIFDDFISVYSPREINIDYKMREDIVEQLNNCKIPDPDVFRDAQMQIYHLMHRDSYPRFLASTQTAQLERVHSVPSKGSKRQHEQCKHKVNTKSRMLCCYSDDSVETSGKFASSEYREMKVYESPHKDEDTRHKDEDTRHKDEDTRHIDEDTRHKDEDIRHKEEITGNKREEDDKKEKSKKLSAKNTDNMTSPSEPTDHCDDSIKVKITRPSVSEEFPRETSKTEMDNTFNEKSGNESNHCDNGVIIEVPAVKQEKIVNVTIESHLEREGTNTSDIENVTRDITHTDTTVNDVITTSDVINDTTLSEEQGICNIVDSENDQQSEQA